MIIHAVLDLVSPWSYITGLYKIQFLDFAVFFVGVVFTFFTTIENDAGAKEDENEKAPRLRAVILDFAGVNLNKYAAHHVEFHFANIANEDIQNALLLIGFGSLEPSASKLEPHGVDATAMSEKSNTTAAKNEESNEKTQHATTTVKKFFHLSLEVTVSAATNSECN
ncbi:989_t:CDS:2 [Ambispora gerdemannii]|uniref:989_t:CDS:1 n=1 Tax=Ambispora gerdemannii TaxID=144530 RepID=A0A9N9C074_9GLOM|nr:989_t:CDS:2 [Ambispora gerdemannii]